MQHITVDIIEMPNGHKQPSWIYFDEAKGCERFHEPNCSYCATDQHAIKAARRSLRRLDLGTYVAYARLGNESVQIDASE